MTTFSWLLRCVGAIHPDLLIPANPASSQAIRDFLRSAAHEGVLRELHHSELPLCFGSLLGATSRTLFAQRGSACDRLVFTG